jgi:hypothetical protein
MKINSGLNRIGEMPQAELEKQHFMQTSCSFNHFGAGTLKFTYVSTS